MGSIKIDFESGNFVGKGEVSAFKILKQLFPQAEIEKQIKLTNYLDTDQIKELSKHQLKESIDIGMWVYGHNYAIRVQDKSHKGRIKARWDRLEKKLLEQNGVTVVDIVWNEAKELFKERVNKKSIQEVIDAFKTAKALIPFWKGDKVES